MKINIKNLLNFCKILIVSIFLNSCASNKRSNIKAVNNFDIEKYYGLWYEQARMDHSFEKDLSNVTANYSKDGKDKITVVNKGYNEKTSKWVESKGEVKFKNEKNPKAGELQVSFFKPFYGDYIIFELDKDYKYAFVGSDTTEYIWLLSRDKEIKKELKDKFINLAETKGYDTTKLIWVKHDKK